jgi:hypothetical protein
MFVQRSGAKRETMRWIPALALLGICTLTGCTDNLGADRIPGAEKRVVTTAPAKDSLAGIVPKEAMGAEGDKTANPTTTETGSPDEIQVGIKFYPKATIVKSPGGELASSRDYGLITVLLETPDPLEKVISFYKLEYPPSPLTQKPTQGLNHIWKRTKRDNVDVVTLQIVDPEAGNELRSAEFRTVEGKTHIELVRVKADKTSKQILTPDTPASGSPGALTGTTGGLPGAPGGALTSPGVPPGSAPTTP